ncbi:MAG: glutamate formiminotransferase/formiminotetrahydrofolate cyclodeaminase [Candidatus Krumholzibacteriia bacterium]|jgi:glutamate formiminotransferase/formiminotetrahydrofolate cyclodeaminase
MKKLVECVPNISEGRDPAIIEAVTAVVSDVTGAQLLDVDPGADTNRTVITIIGSPEGVAEAAFRVVKRASELIDMSKHSGAHPRHGATDVCPFVPVRGVTMEECVAIAQAVGRRIGEELNIPVYLYEDAAASEFRRNLANVRKGEYEALQEKLGSEKWKPDFGPNAWNEATARSGATNVSARGFLVAYNVNINSMSKSIAQNIALDIKEAGRAQRDNKGALVKGPDGESVLVPGPYRLEACKAVGWVIPEYDRAQVSMNLVNTATTKPHEAFDACCKSALDRGVRVTGSELVGLIPEGDMIAAGKHYLKQAGQSAGIPRKMIIETAIQSMGLRELTPFDPAEKIIEYQAGLTDGPLVNMTNREFVDELSSDSPAPGGGSVAALCAAQAAGLVAMVANLTVGKKKYTDVQERVKEIAELGQTLKDFFLAAIDDDTDAFNAVMDTFRLPKANAAQITARDLAIAEATRGATRVPLSVLNKIPTLLELAGEVGKIGNTNSLSDAGVAALSGMAGAEGAYYNVLINLASLAELNQSEEPQFTKETRDKASSALQKCEATAAKVRATIRGALETALDT